MRPYEKPEIQVVAIELESGLLTTSPQTQRDEAFITENATDETD